MPSTKPASRSRFGKQTPRRKIWIGCARRSPNMSPVPTMERASGTARHPDHETSYPNGDDLRRDPLEVRKATLASIVVKANSGIRFKRPDGLRPCLQDGAGGHRVEAQGLTLPLRALAGLVEDEKPGVCGGDARGGGRLELEHGRASAISPSLVPLLQSDAADDIRRDEGEG